MSFSFACDRCGKEISERRCTVDVYGPLIWPNLSPTSPIWARLLARSPYRQRKILDLCEKCFGEVWRVIAKDGAK